MRYEKSMFQIGGFLAFPKKKPFVKQHFGNKNNDISKRLKKVLVRGSGIPKSRNWPCSVWTKNRRLENFGSGLRIFTQLPIRVYFSASPFWVRGCRFPNKGTARETDLWKPKNRLRRSL